MAKQTNEQNKYKILEFEGAEYLELMKIAEFWRSKGKIENPPRFIIVAGGQGAGKSTIIKQKYSDGYVIVDSGKIYRKLTETKTIDRVEDDISLIGWALVSDAITTRKNIVIEIIFDKQHPIYEIVEKMIDIGYKVEIEYVNADIVAAWERYLKNRDNISSGYTEKQTLSWFTQFFDLDSDELEKLNEG